MDNVSISSLRTGGKGNEEAVLRVRRNCVCPVACGNGIGPNESRTRQAGRACESRRARKGGGSRHSRQGCGACESRRTRKGGGSRHSRQSSGACESRRARKGGGSRQEGREGPTGHRDGR